MEKIEKILILGCTGMLGHQVSRLFSKKIKYEVFDLSYRNKLNSNTIICDITNRDSFSKLVDDIRPDIIVNCIGVLIMGSNSNPANAIYVNAYFPHLLRELADKIGSQVIHISTDCVFSGKIGGYTVNDHKDGADMYAQSKSLGELITDNHLTLRTSIVGPELKKSGEGLFHWFMKNDDDLVNGFTQALWSGVTTLELAKVIHICIQNKLTGIYQITNNTVISKYDLLKLFKKYFLKKTPRVLLVQGKSINKSLVDIDFSNYYKVASYDRMISEMKNMMENNRELYSQYFL